MTINTSSPQPAKIATDGATPLTPEQILEQFRVLRLHVPDFGPLATSDSRSLHMVLASPRT